MIRVNICYLSLVLKKEGLSRLAAARRVSDRRHVLHLTKG